MNAPVKIEKTVNADCPAMLANAERWRAQCIDSFAHLETVVEELLIDLQSVSRKDTKVRTGELVGVAFGHLRELTGSNGAFAQKGTKVAVTLANLAPLFGWRAHLTHGVMSVWRGGNGHWLLSFAHRSPGTSEPVRYFAIPWTEAQKMKNDLTEQVEILRESSRSLRNAVKKP